MSTQDTIIALATPNGTSAIAVVRLSGPEAISITNSVFKGKNLEESPSHTIHFGTLRKADKVVDEVLVSVFKAPNSFTKEDSVEVSCHGSPYIVKEIIQLLIQQGARYAKAGEFTQRAFLNGRFDLAQAEAVADLIASDSDAAHAAAMNQMRGGFSKKIAELREQLIHFASMIELELDFSEEDVEFANRDDLKKLIEEILTVIRQLLSSFDLGNVIKNGIQTVIAGKPNAGKSTLLNALLQEEKAIVSSIAGTTRDFIEDEINIEGIKFRFIDTAGLRDARDEIEAIGVSRSREKMAQAAFVIYLFDTQNDSYYGNEEEINLIKEKGIPYIVVGNKIDLIPDNAALVMSPDLIYLSANDPDSLEELRQKLLEAVNLGQLKTDSTVITNARHFESLNKTRESLEQVLESLNSNITGDFLAQDIRHALHYLGEITGDITTDDLLDNIFSKFCIGK